MLKIETGFYEGMEFELHELCQPLTTLRCRLELAMLMEESHAPSESDNLREAVQSGLSDIQRIFQSVERLRQWMLTQTQIKHDAYSGN